MGKDPLGLISVKLYRKDVEALHQWMHDMDEHEHRCKAGRPGISKKDLIHFALRGYLGRHYIDEEKAPVINWPWRKGV